jgi:intracellular septation protein A
MSFAMTFIIAAAAWIICGLATLVLSWRRYGSTDAVDLVADITLFCFGPIGLVVFVLFVTAEGRK